MLSRHSVRCAHAAAASRAATSKAEQITKLPSGLTVASIDNQGPISQLVLMFRAGSRFEGPNQHGLVHYLRDSVGTDSANYPGLSLIWSSAVSGGRVSAFSTRDVYGVSLALPRDESSVGISILGHIAQPAFKPWEIEDVSGTSDSVSPHQFVMERSTEILIQQTLPALKTDNAYKHPYNVAYEDLHRAAYRNGPLARSVYAPKTSIGKISHKALADFAVSAKHLTTGQAVLYGMNIEHERMVLYGDSHAPIANGQKVDAVASPYKGGEWRRPAGGPMAHVLLAGAGAPLSDAKAMATQAVLLASLGRSAAVQFSGSAGNAAVLRAVAGTCGASAFQAAYEDTGLVGVYIVADGAHVAKAVTSAASAIKSYKCSDLEAAKRRATNDLLRATAHSHPTSIERATQILAGLTAEGAIVEAIQQVTASDVEAAAKKLSSKFSLSSYGNIDESVMSQRNEDEQGKPLDPPNDGNAAAEEKPTQQTQGFEGFTYNEDVLKFELPPLPDPLPKCKAALEKFVVPKESDLVRRSFMPLRTHPDHFIEVYFENVTETGKSRLPWELVRPAFLWKVKSCMDEMVRWHRQREGPDSVDLSEGSENKRMYDFILEKAAKFEAAPFTWQRICELLNSPSRHYRKADKYFRALDKTINVVTTVSEDGRRMTGNPQYISETPDVYSIEQLFFGDERPDCDFWDPDFAYNAQKVSGSPNTKDQLEPLDMSRKRAYCSDEEVPRSEESDEEMEF
ncbi:peptidase M16 inactive domain protein [Ostertagia ostertagi]